MSSKSMEQSIKTGRSNASSPGTSSSEGSTNSRGSSQSLNDININSLMSTLLQDVDTGNLNIQRDSTCSHDGSGSNRCTGCVDVNCDICLPGQLHIFFIESSSEFGYEDGNPSNISNHGIGTPNFVSSGLSTLCVVHRDAQKLYCQTCSKPLCGECGVQSHFGHVIMDFTVAVEDAEIQSKEISKEAALAIDALKEELDVVEVEKETLEQELLEAEADVKLWKREVTAALEARDRELLARIERAKRRKAAKLKAKYDDLRNKIDGLSLAMVKLMNTMESDTVDSDPLSLLAVTDMVSAEAFKIDQCRQLSSSQEDNSIDDITVSFDDIVDSFLNFVANFGEVVEYNTGPIGGRVNSLQTLARQTAPAPAASVPKETIPANAFPVTIRLNGDADRSVRPLKIIGNDGDVMDNLCRPWGVACDREGHIVVADRSNNRVQIYRQDGSFVRRFGTHGTAPGQFDRPAGVAVDARRRVVVADKDNHRIQILTMEGQFLLAFGEKGCRCGQFNYPWDVAVNSECQIVVSDTRNHRVQLFSAEGVFLRKYGFEAAPNMWKHFDSPRGVAFNPAGNVVTTDFNNHRVLVIDSDFTDARAFQGECPGDSKLFQRPQGLAIDDEGNVIVADSRNHRIQVFDKNGTLAWKFGSYGKGETEMDCPAGIALCPDGRIAVVDFGNNRVLLF